MAAAQQCAPFLFALLILLITTTTSQGAYGKVCARINPKATKEERLPYRLYFLVNIWFGVLLVMMAIAWWIYAWRVEHEDRISVMKTHISYQFQFSIINARRDLAQVWANYPRMTTTDPTNPNFQIDSFLVNRPEPFDSRMEFEVHVSMPDDAYIACLKDHPGVAETCGRAQSVSKLLRVPYRDSKSPVFNLNISQGTLDPTSDVADLPVDLRPIAIELLHFPGTDT
jgi:hypothetical protein